MKTITLENGKKVEISDKSYKALAKAVQTKTRPDVGEEYWFISAVGIVDATVWGYLQVDKDIWTAGNGFFTEEEAVKENNKRLAVQRIKDYILENDMYFEPDWNTSNQTKYGICYNYGDRKLDWYVVSELKRSDVLPYLATVEHWERVVTDCEEDLEIVFGIEH